MENLPKPPQIPKIQDLYSDLELAKSNDELVALLNQPPNPLWIKTHPYISNYRYLPIDKVEYLLKTIFKKYKIEIKLKTVNPFAFQFLKNPILFL